MLREVVDRFACRYRLWTGETQGDKVAAGEATPEVSPKDEPSWRLIVRFVWGMAGGLIFLAVLYRLAIRTFPSLSDGILMIFIFLAIVCCAVGLFIMGGELVTKCTRTDDHDKNI